MRAKYCKCKNTYTMTKCNERKCPTPDYWGQGLGSLTGGSTFNKTGVIEVGTIVALELISGGSVVSGFPDEIIQFHQSSTSGIGSGAAIQASVVDQQITSIDSVSNEGENFVIGDVITLQSEVSAEDTIVRVTEIEITGTNSDPRTNNNDRAGLWD
jgi:hypothetical protein